jgi:hypothetical protein
VKSQQNAEKLTTDNLQPTTMKKQRGKQQPTTQNNKKKTKTQQFNLYINGFCGYIVSLNYWLFCLVVSG